MALMFRMEEEAVRWLPPTAHRSGYREEERWSGAQWWETGKGDPNQVKAMQERERLLERW